MNLTPFEKAEVNRQKTALLAAVTSATTDLLRVSEVAQQNIDAYKTLIKTGKRSTKAERDITSAAVRDIRLNNEALVLLAQTLEERFGINA